MKMVVSFIILGILTSGNFAWAGFSDPNEIVEKSALDSSLARPAEPAPQSLAQLTETVKSKVNSWLNKGLSFFGTQPESTPPTSPTQARSAQPNPATKSDSRPGADVQVAPVATILFPATLSSQRDIKAMDLKEAARKLKEQGAAQVSSPGRAGDSTLKKTKAGVPLIPMEIAKTVKGKDGSSKTVMIPVTSISRVDIGEEAKISKRDLLLKPYVLPEEKVLEMPKLSSPDFISTNLVKSATQQVITPAEKPKDLEKALFGLDRIITHQSIEQTMPKLAALLALNEKPYTELTPPQLKMLAAVMFYNRGDKCPMLLGLFDELSQNEKFATEANYMLGSCAYKLKMTSLGFDRLSQVARSESSDFAKDAIALLAKDLPPDYEVAFAKLIRELKDPKLISDKMLSEAHYLTAKGSFKDGDYESAKSFAEKVPESSGRYSQAQFISSLAWFSLGNGSKAVNKLESLRGWMSAHKVNDKNLNSLTAINLARLKFMQGKVKEALPLYLSIDKDHPMWVQGLVEQGWTQLAVDDYAGAIGNMYSLHSPYFKSVYKPESFVVRTIGYLNICQYGDAYRTLSWLEHEARPWADSVSLYLSKKPGSSQFYQTVVTYLKSGKSDQEVDGLPPQVIREMARQREFLNLQTALNVKADEIGRYDGIERLIDGEKANLRAREMKATGRFKDLKARIAKAEKERTQLAEIDQWRQQMRLEREIVIGLRHQSEVLETSKKLYAPLKSRAVAKFEKERQGLKDAAAKELAGTLNRIKDELQTVLENNEFLRYEVFAGSGENIRYQVAGGKVSDANRLPANVKPTKLLNWTFDGEYWEDEIGSYRSSLHNNCPNAGKMESYFKETDPSTAAKKAELEKGVRQ